MVIITEITEDRYVRTVSGSWAIGADGTWIFIANHNNAVRRLRIREGEKLSSVWELVREAYGQEYMGCQLHMTYQWPDWMDMEATFGGRTKPVTIATDETMGFSLAMRFELDDLSLFVSKLTVDGVPVDDGMSQTSSYRLPAKGKSPLYCNEERSSNYESAIWKRLMDDEAVLQWMCSKGTEGTNMGDSSSNVHAPPAGATVEPALTLETNQSMDTASEKADEEGDSNLVEADLLANLGLPSINLATDNYGSDSGSEGYNDENEYDGGETLECNFFGPSATIMTKPLGVHLDLQVPLQQALEDMCINFASFNRDVAPTLDEQGEEGRVRMELAIRDVVYEGDELFVGRVFKNKQDCNVKAARAYRICEFHTYFNEVIRLDLACAWYLEPVGICHWTRAYFLGKRYNVMTSNVAESLNAVLKEARELPIISLLEFIRTTLISWFAMRREAARSETSALPPKMREVVHQNFQKSVRFAVHRIDRYDYEVRREGSSVFHVKLMERTCSCRAFDLLHLPCPHAIAAAVVEGVPIQGLMAPEYSVESWRMSFQGTIRHVPDVSDVFALPEPIASLHLFPPATRRPSGRPKKRESYQEGNLRDHNVNKHVVSVAQAQDIIAPRAKCTYEGGVVYRVLLMGYKLCNICKGKSIKNGGICKRKGNLV
ncbi:hypothetical protein AXX17_ATUG01860 [Arabidopsis thaliana]|uniref:SWIM-type domain-containing protein n=1 Tax=Arabidopsis thaliana TaxID=3702 RepID=A0A178U826_ARATH|nr:hypothetical protein AXX17_ATUG01860 [Arabidopsis thaliana]